MKETYCKNCRFWRKSLNEKTPSVGECRRYAPSPRSLLLPREGPEEGVQSDLDAHWPVTWDDEWCGEFEEC
jgi:hypothetical protein